MRLTTTNIQVSTEIVVFLVSERLHYDITMLGFAFPTTHQPLQLCPHHISPTRAEPVYKCELGVGDSNNFQRCHAKPLWHHMLRRTAQAPNISQCWHASPYHQAGHPIRRIQDASSACIGQWCAHSGARC